MDVLEKPRPEDERIVMVIWPDDECDPRAQQLRRFDAWLRRRTRWQLYYFHASVDVVFITLILWLKFVLNSRGLAVNLRGAPGTGKTFTLQEIKRGLEQAERPIVAVAPTKSAEEQLRLVGFNNAATIEGLLQDKDAQRRMFNSVLIVDEAGMVGARQMFELLSLAAKCGSRVIFSDDTRQINSVEAGDALRILEKESKHGTVEPTTPRRQRGDSAPSPDGRPLVIHPCKEARQGENVQECTIVCIALPWRELA